MGRFRIATFNLENLDEAPHGGAPLPARIAALRPQLLRLNADILCLQEVNAHEAPDRHSRTLAALDRLLDGTPYAAYSRVAMTGPSGLYPADRQNLVLLSRWPVLESRQIQHDIVAPLSYRPVTAAELPAAPIETRFDRPIVHAVIALPNGRRLHVLNLHLKAPLAAAIAGQKQSAFVWKTTAGWAEGFFVAALKRSGQALEARLLIDRLFDADKDALIAVCGDFNADNREVPVRIVLGDPNDTGNQALASRAMAALERDVPAERRYSVRHAGHLVMLDHVLVSRPLLAWFDHGEVHNEALEDEVAGTALRPPPGSFHAPVVAEFALPD